VLRRRRARCEDARQVADRKIADGKIAEVATPQGERQVAGTLTQAADAGTVSAGGLQLQRAAAAAADHHHRSADFPPVGHGNVRSLCDVDAATAIVEERLVLPRDEHGVVRRGDSHRFGRLRRRESTVRTASGTHPVQRWFRDAAVQL